jgi:NAD(P)-dependent dehydrogenase (short-subunit alcohol dehydrogenase family)
VVVADFNADGGELTASLVREQGGEAVFVRTDVSKSDDVVAMVDAAVSHFGGLNFAVNAAAIEFETVNLADLADDDFDRMIAVNLRGPFLLARAAAPHMIARKWGRIVNITTSYSTMIRGGNMPYGQTKSGLEAGSASWADDLAGTGVTVNVLIPGGAADTGMIPQDAMPDRSKLVAPSAMVAPISYLSSNASDGVTGKRFVAQFFDSEAPLAAPGCAPVAWPDLAAGASKGLGEGAR